MDKQEVARYLVGIGYDAKVIGKSVVILVDRPLRRGEKDHLRNVLRSVSYRGTWGWRQRQREVGHGTNEH